ncbi:MAG: hypothetical protein MJ204_05755 [Bacteroidales bacterium]|nr:hypothetical protein [Bacteroidales bacterium]
MKKRLTISPILKTLFVIFILIGNVSFSGIAQQKRLTEKEKQEKIDSLINNSDVIVEGVDKIYASTTINGQNYNLHRIRIQHVFRGEDIDNGTFVYFLQKEDNILSQSTVTTCGLSGYIHNHHFSRGIYFLSNHSITIPDSLKDGKTILLPTSFSEWGISTIEQGKTPYYGLFKTPFNSFYEIFSLLSMYGNIRLPIDIDTPTQSVQANDSTLKKKDIEKENFYRRLTRGQITSTKYLLKESSTNDVSCTIYADNQELKEENGKYYFCFDLSVKYESSLYDTIFPNEILLFVKYNTTSLGTNIVNNNKISCTLKSNFADTAGIFYPLM